MTWKCRCGAHVLPLLPTSPIRSPRLILSPSLTLIEPGLQVRVEHVEAVVELRDDAVAVGLGQRDALRQRAGLLVAQAVEDVDDGRVGGGDRPLAVDRVVGGLAGSPPPLTNRRLASSCSQSTAKRCASHSRLSIDSSARRWRSDAQQLSAAT